MNQFNTICEEKMKLFRAGVYYRRTQTSCLSKKKPIDQEDLEEYHNWSPENPVRPSTTIKYQRAHSNYSKPLSILPLQSRGGSAREYSRTINL